MDTDTLIWIAIAIAVVIAVALVAVWIRSSRRRARLREQFGAEYERTVEHSDSRREAERDLDERVRERESFELQPLSLAAREQYSQEWQAIQARFVDTPETALTDAEGVVTRLMRDRGYPVDELNGDGEKAKLVSVDHPDVVEHYRRARTIERRNRHGEASTEDLRQAMVHIRYLFDDLLREEETTSG